MSRDGPHSEAVVERWNDLFRALSAEPRRQLLLSLLDADAGDWVRLPRAAAAGTVAADGEELTVQLHHTHLPVLTERGYVEWSADPFRATRGPAFQDVATVLEAVEEHADRLPDRLVAGCRHLREARDGD